MRFRSRRPSRSAQLAAQAVSGMDAVEHLIETEDIRDVPVGRGFHVSRGRVARVQLPLLEE